MRLKKVKNNGTDKLTPFSPEINSSITNSKPNTNQLIQNLQAMTNITQVLQMNTIANMDRAIFIRNLLGLPQTLKDVLVNAQNPNNPLIGGTLGIDGINQELIKNQKILASLFDDNIQVYSFGKFLGDFLYKFLLYWISFQIEIGNFEVLQLVVHDVFQ